MRKNKLNIIKKELEKLLYEIDEKPINKMTWVDIGKKSILKDIIEMISKEEK